MRVAGLGAGLGAGFPGVGVAVTCAVSGGADSLALLVLAVEAGCVVTAVHVDHGAREGSAAEADVVAAAAARFGAGFDGRRVEVKPGPNLEARWRAARRAALPAGALTGHTADDQAETVLLNLLRGAGLDGLAGIRPGPTKPLLALRRADTRAVCAAAGLVPVDDPSNLDPAFRRNRVRHELLPLLNAIGERDVAGVLARQAALLREDADLLEGLAAGLDPTDAASLASAPAPLARRAVRRWLGGEHPPDAATVERVLAVARRQAVACELPGGGRVERSGMVLRLRPGGRLGA
ncbi:MAG TPA: tRNA lysidine(34) synthetase TilS [Acidimicrobiales bacterium]|nr:tRNA lysidine(34) synthetase TilS [Acidimicrobiales bacterium]